MLHRSPGASAVGFALFTAGALAAPDAGAAAVPLVDLHVGLKAGGMTGRSFGGPPGRQRDFFEMVRGPAVGFDAGCKLLGLDLSVRFFQVLEGRGEIGDPGARASNGGGGQIGDPGVKLAPPSSGIQRGTMTQLLLGFEMDLAVAERWTLKPRIAGGLALGTREEVAPPLDSDDVTHKGIVAEGILALERRVARLVSVGVEAVVGYHYLLGGTLVVNDARNWSRGAHGLALFTMTAHLGL